MPHLLQLMYIDLITKCYDARSKYRAKELTAFWGRKGQHATGELMVVGRAVNGWDDLIWNKEELGDPKDIHPRVVALRQISETTDKCPMQWVNECWQTRVKDQYNTAQSPFWRVIRRVAMDLGVAKVDESWPSYLMWSNLYKVSPSKTGNPSNSLCEVQRETCGDILEAEIGRWQPKRILFLTDRAWTDWFLNRLNATPGNFPNSKYVQWVGTLAGATEPIRVVITVRPEQKPEDTFVSEVVRAFS